MKNQIWHYIRENKQSMVIPFVKIGVKGGKMIEKVANPRRKAAKIITRRLRLYTTKCRQQNRVNRDYFRKVTIISHSNAIIQGGFLVIRVLIQRRGFSKVWSELIGSFLSSFRFSAVNEEYDIWLQFSLKSCENITKERNFFSKTTSQRLRDTSCNSQYVY